MESPLLWSWAQLQPVGVGGARLVPPPDVVRCAGAHSVCDIQLSQVSPRSFTPLGPVCAMFRLDGEERRSCNPNVPKHQLSHPVLSLRFSSLFSVDFSKPVSSSFRAHSSRFAAQSDGRAQVVLSWWDLEMDPGGSVVCSMAPSWTCAAPKTTPVRQRRRR